MPLNTPLTSEELTIQDRADLQRAAKQSLFQAATAIGTFTNNIKSVESRGNDGSAQILSEAKALRDQLVSVLEQVRADTGF